MKNVKGGEMNMANKGKKLKAYKVYMRGKKKCYGTELAFSKANATKNVQKTWGKKAYVK